MAVTVQSTATAGFINATSITITKPSGLVVGDMLIAGIVSDDEDLAVPSGWTEYQDADTAGGPYTSLFYKIADSSDVAASNFTFATTGGGAFMAGGLLRVDGYAPTSLFSGGETEVDTNSTTQYNLGVSLSPRTDGELIIVVCGGAQTSLANSVSSPAINGANPTWTEVLDVSILQTFGNHANAYIAYANQTTKADITSFTATLTNTQGSTDGVSVIATLSPATDASGTSTTLEITPTLYTGAATSGVTATLDTLLVSPTLNEPTITATAPTQWQKKSKNPTDWTKQNKSL